jgi:hypothetical protein
VAGATIKLRPIVTLLGFGTRASSSANGATRFGRVLFGPRSVEFASTSPLTETRARPKHPLSPPLARPWLSKGTIGPFTIKWDESRQSGHCQVRTLVSGRQVIVQ